MSKPDTWMPFYPGDYIADTRRLSLEHHGAYLLLILDYWKSGPLPNDDETLARVINSTVAVWRRLSPVLRPLFRVDGDVLRHKRIDEEIAAATERQAKAAQKASAAAAARWAKHPKEDAPSNATSNAPSNAPSIPQAMHEECPSPSSSQSSLRSEEHAAPKRAKVTKVGLPTDFAISLRVAEWAAEKGHSDIQRRFEHFVGKAKASGYRYTDWDQAFMNAIREDWAGLNGQAQRPVSIHEKRSATARAMYGETLARQPADITADSERLA